MGRLQRLIQKDDGWLYDCNGNSVNQEVDLIGKIKTLTVKHPCLDIDNVLDEMHKENSSFIPRDAVAYTTSDFNPDTQHIRKEGKKENIYSVYAIQFYQYSAAF